jgi:hypothetical protein
MRELVQVIACDVSALGMIGEEWLGVVIADDYDRPEHRCPDMRWAAVVQWKGIQGESRQRHSCASALEIFTFAQIIYSTDTRVASGIWRFLDNWQSRIRPGLPAV